MQAPMAWAQSRLLEKAARGMMHTLGDADNSGDASVPDTIMACNEEASSLLEVALAVAELDPGAAPSPSLKPNILSAYPLSVTSRNRWPSVRV